MSLNSLWTRGLSKQEAEDVKQNITNDKKTLDIVRNLVYNIYIDSLSVVKSDYDSPSWPYRKAYTEGQQSALESLLRLLDIEGDDRTLVDTKRKALTDVRTKLRS